MSFLWGIDVLLRTGYLSQVRSLWEGYPLHPMIFLHKLFFIIQLAYYLHLLPELYFQKVKKEDQQPKIIHAIASFAFVALAYFWGFQRIALALLTLHYFGEFITHTFVMIEIFDREEKLTNLSIANKISFVITRFATIILSVLTLYFGLEGTAYATRGLIAFFAVSALQGHLVFEFLKNLFVSSRAQKTEQSQPKKVKSIKVEKSKKERKRESDLPEADQDAGVKKAETKKVK